MVRSSCDAIIMTGKASAFSEHLDVAKHLLATMASFTLPMVWGMKSGWFRPLGRTVFAATTTMAPTVQSLDGKMGRNCEINIGPYILILKIRSKLSSIPC